MNRVNLPAEIAAAIRFRWQGGAHGVLLSALFPDDFDHADEAVRAVLPGFLSVRSWDEITGLTRAIANHFSYGTDDRGVIFHNPPKREDARQVGFSIEDGTDNELLLGEQEFMVLAGRWLGALRDGALDHGDPAGEADWWQQWEDAVEDIQAEGRREASI